MNKRIETDEKLEMDTDITVNIPFTYTIGDEGNMIGRPLLTLDDVFEEIRAELNEGCLDDSALVEFQGNGYEI